MGISKRVLAVLVAALAFLTLSLPVAGSEDPFNGSWEAVDERDDGLIQLRIGGGKHHVVGSDQDGGLCRPSVARFSGFGEIADGNLVVDLAVYCFDVGRGGAGRFFAGVVPNATFIDNGDGTLTWQFTNLVLHKTGK